jgi:hypothetical protein
MAKTKATLEVYGHAGFKSQIEIGDPTIVGDPNIMPVHVIVGGADGTLVTIDAQGHIRVRPPEGPGPTEIREAVSAMIEAAGVIAKVALNPQPIPPGRKSR